MAGISNIELKRAFLCFRSTQNSGEKNRVIGESCFSVVITIIEA